jgi:formylglycine-generating enzyme required for sulfatase activity
MFQLGSVDGDFGNVPDLPERVVLVDPLRFDRWEVSVARWRKALADGFTSPDATPTVNDGPIPITHTDFLDPTMCSFSSQPLGREDYPLSCVSWDAARAFCRFQGGDLPTEAEWEYVATISGRDRRTRFSWGGDDDVAPSCARAVWGRGDVFYSGQFCLMYGFGPLPVEAHVGPDGDLTPGLAIAGLGGNLAEWMRDAFAPMTATCWASSPLHEPGCIVDGDTERALRGGSWRDNIAGILGANRRGASRVTSGIGFRCMRGGAP